MAKMTSMAKTTDATKSKTSKRETLGKILTLFLGIICFLGIAIAEAARYEVLTVNKLEITRGGKIVSMDSLDVDTTGDMIFTVTANAAGEDMIFDLNGNQNASILISSEGSGTDSVKVETLTNGGDIIVSSVDNIQITSTTAAGLIDIDGTAGLVYSIAEDDTTADNIDIGSAKDDLDLEGEDITLDTADDMNFAIADDLQIAMESAAGVFNVNGTLGAVYTIATDNSVADDIDIGSALDDLDLEGEDITLDTADDMDFAVADDLQIALESAGGIFNVNGTLGAVYTVGTDNSVADDIDIGSALDDVDIEGEDITLDTADDGNATVADDWTFTMESAGGVFGVTGTLGFTINLGTDDTTADTINIGSAKDATTIYGNDLILDSADDLEFNVADDLTVSMETAGGIFAVNGTLGAVYNIGTDNSAKDTITIGSALDDVIIAGTPGVEAGAGAGVVAAERCVGSICQTVFTLTNATITITDPGGAAAYGGLKIYDFPEGRLLALGVVADLTLTEASGTIDAAFDGDISLGTTAADVTATLHNPVTEDDWVPTVSTTQAIASVAAADFQSTVTEQVIHDGHTTPIDLYLNVEIDDADITTGGADSLTANGTITVTWINLGDN